MNKPATPCAVCGQPTASKEKVCYRTAECVREHKRREYQANREVADERSRRWAQENPEARREISRRWDENHREENLEAARLYREANRDVLRIKGNRYYAADPDAHRERTYRYYEENREKMKERARGKSREWRLRYKHGLSIEGWVSLWDAQLGRCYLCGDPLSEDASMDHDHSCCPSPYTCWICRRGLACHDCNVSIGFAKDDPDRLRRMADALEAAQLEVERRKTAPSPALGVAVIGTLLTVCSVSTQ